MCPGHGNWKWEAISHGTNSFLISILSADDLWRIDGLQTGSRISKHMCQSSSWKRERVAMLFVMEPAWIHVFFCYGAGLDTC
jgi:hypothetical protein